jgi:hypothetical protein
MACARSQCHCHAYRFGSLLLLHPIRPPHHQEDTVPCSAFQRPQRPAQAGSEDVRRCERGTAQLCQASICYSALSAVIHSGCDLMLVTAYTDLRAV